MNLEEFERIVDEVVDSLPQEFKSELDNVEIQVEIWPSEEDLRSIYAHPGVTLFGLYRGIPKTKRGNNYTGVIPDKIVIFAGPIMQFSSGEDSAKKQIRQTVLHEIGHYFGMSEHSIRKAQEQYS
jgi:predicted Zn-dependent protease with MMP-like domain